MGSSKELSGPLSVRMGAPAAPRYIMQVHAQHSRPTRPTRSAPRSPTAAPTHASAGTEVPETQSFDGGWTLLGNRAAENGGRGDSV